MKADVVVVGDVMILASIKRMYERGEITLEQYAACLRRSKENNSVRTDKNESNS